MSGLKYVSPRKFDNWLENVNTYPHLLQLVYIPSSGDYARNVEQSLFFQQ